LVEWDRLLKLARRERVTPLLHHVFADASHDSGAPVEFLRAAGRDYHEGAGRYLLLSAGLGDVLGALRKAEVEALVLKGMALAEPVYEDPALRPMDDIDLLVRREDAPRARAALGDLGCYASNFDDDLRRRAATLFAPPGRRSARPALDLHWDLVDERYGPAASRWADGVWDRAREFKVGGISVRALSPADALIHACVHLAVHHGLRGLLWHCDLAMMVRAWKEEIEWKHLADRVVDARLAGMVYAALKSAEATVGLSVPASIFSRLRPRSLRTRAFVKCLLPHLVALRSIPYQDYVIPLLLMDRGRDVLALVLRRFLLTQTRKE
jgi:hypothetical protein